ncbi:VOC family protein [Cystobacter fuscus]|nr:VOC family protein [Cystobacter fuscus]
MPQTVIPQLRMRHADTTLPFYVRGLGFVIDWQHRFEPGLPLFAQLTRDGQTIFLTEHSGDCEVGGAVYFIVEDVDALHRAFSAAGVPIEQPPHDTEWETREMLLVDPDGNRLRFATDAG